MTEHRKHPAVGTPPHNPVMHGGPLSECPLCMELEDTSSDFTELVNAVIDARSDLNDKIEDLGEAQQAECDARSRFKKAQAALRRAYDRVMSEP